jgi:hypothetical protein
MAADVNTGRLGETANRNPAETGAATPVLLVSLACPEFLATYNLDKAAEVPQAVPLMEVPNVSGVIPSILSAVADMSGMKDLTQHGIHGCRGC